MATSREQMNERGMSLMELVLVIATVGMVLALTGESVGTLIMRYQSQTVAAELVAELQATRLFAMTHRVRVRVLLAPDTARMKAELADPPGTLIREYDFERRGVVVHELTNGPALMFYPSGRSASPSTITLRNAIGRIKQVAVSITGRVKVK
ncbi:MAG: GspH/FimT family pseudopilin [Nitrospiraceae bacterium]